MSFSISPYLLPKPHHSATTFSSSPPPLRNRALSGFVDTIHVLLPPPLVSRGGRRCRRCSSSSSGVWSYETMDFEKKTERVQWLDLYRRVSMMEGPNKDVTVVLEQWEAEQERKIFKSEAFRVAKRLRKFGRFRPALEVYEWMVAQGRFPFHSSDAAILLDLIAKVRGISTAEEYFMDLPEAFRDKRTYAALLNVYVRGKQKGKAEAVLKTMRNKGYLTDALSYNVVMTMYRDLQEHEKVISLIEEMMSKNIRFDEYSFNIWITTCAAIGDVEEIDKISNMVDTYDHVHTNWSVFSTLATTYFRQGNIKKAEWYVQATERRLTGRDRLAFEHLLVLYSLLDKREEVYKTWQSYRSSFPNILNSGFHSMLSALVKLGDIDGAEFIFQEWLSTTPTYDSRICNILLLYYLKHGQQLAKAESCLDDFHNRGGRPNATTCEILAEIYIARKKVSEALSMLKMAAAASRERNLGRWKPRPTTVAKFRALCEEQNSMASMEPLVEIIKELKCLDDEEYAFLVPLSEMP